MSTAQAAAVPEASQPASTPAGEWRGRRLGERTVAWTERDAMLYALAVGATPTDLDLVFEKRLRVLPTFALTLAQWAPDTLGVSGAFEVGQALHGASTGAAAEGFQSPKLHQSSH